MNVRGGTIRSVSVRAALEVIGLLWGYSVHARSETIGMLVYVCVAFGNTEMKGYVCIFILTNVPNKMNKMTVTTERIQNPYTPYATLESSTDSPTVAATSATTTMEHTHATISLESLNLLSLTLYVCVAKKTPTMR